MQTEKDILEYWFEKRNLSNATRELYKGALRQYSQLIGKTIIELLDEADDEEEKGVRLKRRGYSKYTVDFKRHLIDNKKSDQTIRSYLNSIKSFYKANDIRPPEVTVQKGDMTMEKNYGYLISKDEIKQMVNMAYPRDRAIIYVMALSEMSQREVRDLTLKKFIDSSSRSSGVEINDVDDLFKNEERLTKGTIITLEITRTKVNYRYHTFIPPEATKQILTYLKERKYGENVFIGINTLDEPLFVMVTGQPLTRGAVAEVFIKLGQRAGFKHEFRSYRSWRSHGLRKYFISTIINNLGDHILADYLTGHKSEYFVTLIMFFDILLK